MSTVLVPLAPGFEEIEAVSIIDVLRRAGIEVIAASIDRQSSVCGANGISILTEKSVEDISSDLIDMIVLPGGWGGTKILAENIKVQSLLKEMDEKGKKIGAICAAPFALDQAGVLKNSYTCYPSVEEQIKNKGYKASQKVVFDQNIITSRGPATAICFALEIVGVLEGNQMKQTLKEGLLAEFC
jgi:protein deglycase